MSRNKKKKTPHETIRLSGRNVYTDKQKRTIYYDRLTGQGYLLHKEHENKMQFFKNRFPIILFAAILCAGTFLTWMQAVLAGVITAVIVELYFRLSYLKKLEVVTDIDFERRISAIDYIVQNKSRGSVGALCVLYFLFAILVVLNAYLEQYNLGLMILSGGLSLVGLYFGILHIIAFFRMK
ncbi:MAG: hypothetical protein KHY77_05675 [Butyricicoccus pullicaecorum]|nr:hypothetical protein [Butyricicoccus pullicaecorum]